MWGNLSNQPWICQILQENVIFFYAKQFPLGVKLNPQGYIITLVIAWNLQLIAYSLVLTQIAKVISYSLDC